MSLGEFIDMGGYARYLWPSFGLTLAILIYNAWAARRAHAAAREQALRRLAATESRP